MVSIVVQVWFPPSKAGEVGRKVLEVEQAYPEDETSGKVIVPGIVEATEKGEHVITIRTCEDDKIKECMEFAKKRMLMASSIEGLFYSIGVFSDLGESLALLGLSMPES
jgi:hypothetical protein